jgi:hypothetical protein
MVLIIDDPVLIKTCDFDLSNNLIERGHYFLLFFYKLGCYNDKYNTAYKIGNCMIRESIFDYFLLKYLIKFLIIILTIVRVISRVYPTLNKRLSDIWNIINNL